MEFEKTTLTGDYYNDDELWRKALDQIERRLKSALKNLARYNRFVEKKFPLACRTGKIKRELTRPRKSKRPLSIHKIQLLEETLDRARNQPLVHAMTLNRYMRTVAIAYDAGFKELRSLSPLAKYKKKADGRHGGLLDISSHDPIAFSKWFHSEAWSGCHPWEIVFGHPHGSFIMC